MNIHFGRIAFLIGGIVLSGNLLAEGSGTNQTDSTAGTSLRSSAAANASASDKQLSAIQIQHERLVALTAQLNELLTKYTEKDSRVQATRKQIIELQKQLALELTMAAQVQGSGTNRTAKTKDAIIESTIAPAKISSAAAQGGTTSAKITNAAPSGGGDVTATTHGRTAEASTAISDNTNPLVKLVSMETLDDKHRLAIGDKLSFRIEEDKYRLEPAGGKQNERSEDDPTPLLVTDSGELEMPYIGRFPAENKTCKKLAYELKAALEKDYFYKATVILAVDLKAKTLGRVYLTGAIHEPGPEEIPSDEVLTLGKAILRAGGFTDFAERHSVKVTRKAAGSSETKTLVVDVAKVFDKGRTELDLPLEPGDLILVPERLVRF